MAQQTRLGVSGFARSVYGSFAGKTPATGADLIALARAVSRFVSFRLFGRVN